MTTTVVRPLQSVPGSSPPDSAGSQFASAPRSQTNAAGREEPHRDPDLLQANQAEGRVQGKVLRVVELFITSQTAEDRLAQHIRQRQLRIPAATVIGQVVEDQLVYPEMLI